MKTRILLLGLISLCTSSISLASIISPTNKEEQGSGGNGGKAIAIETTVKSVQASGYLNVSKQSIEITYASALQNSKIVVKDEAGNVYSEKRLNILNTRSIPKINLPLLPEGKYIIEFIDSENALIDKGYFEIK